MAVVVSTANDTTKTFHMAAVGCLLATVRLLALLSKNFFSSCLLFIVIRTADGFVHRLECFESVISIAIVCSVGCNHSLR